jgi:hypothetical protein
MSASRPSTRSPGISFEEAYWVGLWQDPDLFGISERLQNVKISGATPFFNIYEWDLIP